MPASDSVTKSERALSAPDQLVSLAGDLLHRGDSAGAVKIRLCKEGLSVEAASAMVSKLESEASARGAAKRRQTVWIGALFLLGGATAAIVFRGSPGVSLAWGIAGFGAMHLLWGLRERHRAKTRLAASRSPRAD